jgi:hypothetical protein
MDEDGTPIIKLDIGNLASFGFDPPAEIMQAIVRNLPHTAGYTDSKGLLASREAVVRYAQRRHSKEDHGTVRRPSSSSTRTTRPAPSILRCVARNRRDRAREAARGVRRRDL